MKEGSLRDTACLQGHCSGHRGNLEDTLQWVTAFGDVDMNWLCLIRKRCMVYVEKAMATHSSTLAWKIPLAEEPGRLPSMVLLRVGHD